MARKPNGGFPERHGVNAGGYVGEVSGAPWLHVVTVLLVFVRFVRFLVGFCVFLSSFVLIQVDGPRSSGHPRVAY